MFYSSLCFVALLAASENELLTNTTLNECIQITQALTPQLSPEEIQEPVVTPIVITNAIEPSMLNYKHWTGTYSPEDFTLYINQTELKMGDTYTVQAPQEPIHISFSYSFMNGMRKGKKAYTYKMNSVSTSATLTFSWLDQNKVLIDNATLVGEDTV